MPKVDKFWMYACLIALIGLFMLMDVARAYAANIYSEPEPDTFTSAATLRSFVQVFSGNTFTATQILKTILNDNAPIGVSGTVSELTWYAAGVQAEIDGGWYDFGGTEFLSCDVPWVPEANSGMTCSGTQTSLGGGVASYVVNGEYLTVTLNTPATLTGSEYIMVGHRIIDQQVNHQERLTMSIGGTSGGACNMTMYDVNNSFMQPAPMDARCPSDITDITAGYIALSDGGFVPPGPPEPTMGDLTILYPTNATTTASTTFPVVIGYTIGDDLSDFSLDGSLPSRIGIEISYDDLYAPGGYTYLPIMWDIASSTGAHATTTDITLPIESDYSLQAKLILDFGFIPPLEGCSPNPPFVTCEGSQSLAVYQWDEVTFSAVNGAMGVIGFQPGGGPFGGGSALATTTCNIANISGCFQNAITFLFFPSPDALSTFSFLWENVRNKPPFGYVSQTIGALNTISVSGTASFEFGDLPFMDEIFTPLKNGLEGLLWLTLIVGFLYRLRELDI